jgi:small ligand-binding sensory domain FIST
MALSQAVKAEIAVSELAEQICSQFEGQGQVGGGLILATAGAGQDGAAVAGGLSELWPEAVFFGTSFEGILGDGRTFRGEPAFAILAWLEDPIEPVPLLFGPEEQDPARIAEAILSASGRSALTASDLILLFPDASGSVALDPILAKLAPLVGRASMAGSGAAGVDGRPAESFFGGEIQSGALIGLFVPGAAVDADQAAPPPRVRAAFASRSASPWLEITSCRARWVDTLDGERPLDWIRRQLGLSAGSPIEPHLDRLLVRTRRRGDSAVDDFDAEYDERYIVGIDDRQGSFSLPDTVRSGDQLAFALPDADHARQALRAAVDELEKTPLLLQFACRTRDEALHGDPDVESAWVAHHAPERRILGTISPFQLANRAPGVLQRLVHATVLTAIDSD